MYLYRLAETLGRTVEELLDSMSGAELDGWMAYHSAQHVLQEQAQREANTEAKTRRGRR